MFNILSNSLFGASRMDMFGHSPQKQDWRLRFENRSFNASSQRKISMIPSK